jgi:hypothetical protein
MAPGDPSKKTRKPSLGAEADDEATATTVDPNMRVRMMEEAEKHEKMKTDFPIPPGWNPRTMPPAEFAKREKDILKAQADGASALDLALSMYELESLEHFEWLKRRFEAVRGTMRRA